MVSAALAMSFKMESDVLVYIVYFGNLFQIGIHFCFPALPDWGSQI